MSNKKNKPKKYDDDDGRVIADMNVEGFRWYRKERKDGGEPIKLTKQERRAMLKAGFLIALPLVAIIAVGLVAAYFLMRLWLS